MRITVLGDTMCSEKYLRTLSEASEENFRNSIECIERIKEKSDFVILNLETPVAGENLGVKF